MAVYQPSMTLGAGSGEAITAIGIGAPSASVARYTSLKRKGTRALSLSLGIRIRGFFYQSKPQMPPDKHFSRDVQNSKITRHINESWDNPSCFLWLRGMSGYGLTINSGGE